VCDWVVVFDRARVLEQGPPVQIFEQPTVARTREFLSHLGWHADADEPGSDRSARLASRSREGR
jgi:ABC-type methionine transport system ATPase subunit